MTYDSLDDFEPFTAYPGPRGIPRDLPGAYGPPDHPPDVYEVVGVCPVCRKARAVPEHLSTHPKDELRAALGRLLAGAT